MAIWVLLVCWIQVNVFLTGIFFPGFMSVIWFPWKSAMVDTDNHCENHCSDKVFLPLPQWKGVQGIEAPPVGCSSFSNWNRLWQGWLGHNYRPNVPLIAKVLFGLEMQMTNVPERFCDICKNGAKRWLQTACFTITKLALETSWNNAVFFKTSLSTSVLHFCAIQNLWNVCG